MLVAAIGAADDIFYDVDVACGSVVVVVEVVVPDVVKVAVVCAVVAEVVVVTLLLLLFHSPLGSLCDTLQERYKNNDSLLGDVDDDV